MAFLATPGMLDRIQKIIDRYHGAAAAALFGPDGATADEWQLAVRAGLVDAQTPVVPELEAMGARSVNLPPGTLDSLPLARIREIIRKTPQTRRSRSAQRFAARQGTQAVRALGLRSAAQVASVLIETGRRFDVTVRQDLRDAQAARAGSAAAANRMLDRGVDPSMGRNYLVDQAREAIREAKESIDKTLNNGVRGMQQAVQTQAHDAINEGVKEALKDEAATETVPGGLPPRVLAFRIPRPIACKHCIRLYLTAGLGSPPRLYWLDELEGNGTNVGRRAIEWRPVVGPTHPWCGCSLQRVPPVIVAQLPPDWRSGEGFPKLVGPQGQFTR